MGTHHFRSVMIIRQGSCAGCTMLRGSVRSNAPTNDPPRSKHHAPHLRLYSPPAEALRRAPMCEMAVGSSQNLQRSTRLRLHIQSSPTVTSSPSIHHTRAAQPDHGGSAHPTYWRKFVVVSHHSIGWAPAMSSLSSSSPSPIASSSSSPQSRSSTSNLSVAPPGILGGDPESP